MSVPPSYSTSSEYLVDLIIFLKDFQWIFNYSNTHILVNKILTNFPSEWMLYFRDLSNEELNNLPTNNFEKNCPSSLKDVLCQIEKLKPNSSEFPVICECQIPHNLGLSEKKFLEIVSLGPIVNDICNKNNVNVIVDVGSGQGHFCHMLNDKYKFHVLGIDGSTDYINFAHRNQEKHYPYSKGKVVFAEYFINEESCDTIKLLVEKHFPSALTCITGLHACADLSITILDLFSKLEFVKCLVIMPCCYHRIKLKSAENEQEYFENFPVSKLFREIFQQHQAETFIRRPFLRLASQQSVKSFTNMTEQQHEQHSRSAMYRAILQEVAESENCRVRRLKRKSGKCSDPDPEKDLQAYLNNLQYTHELVFDGESENEHISINDERFLTKMREKWYEHKDGCYLVEVLTAFQASIQSICENFVLLDRVEFLKEKGFDCYVKKVTNDRISPRCYALITVKP